MTEANMKKLYEHFIRTGQIDRANEILAIPRYAKFKNSKEGEVDEIKFKREK